MNNNHDDIKDGDIYQMFQDASKRMSNSAIGVTNLPTPSLTFPHILLPEEQQSIFTEDGQVNLQSTFTRPVYQHIARSFYHKSAKHLQNVAEVSSLLQNLQCSCASKFAIQPLTRALSSSSRPQRQTSSAAQMKAREVIRPFMPLSKEEKDVINQSNPNINWFLRHKIPPAMIEDIYYYTNTYYGTIMCNHPLSPCDNAGNFIQCNMNNCASVHPLLCNNRPFISAHSLKLPSTQTIIEMMASNNTNTIASTLQGGENSGFIDKKVHNRRKDLKNGKELKRGRGRPSTSSKRAQNVDEYDDYKDDSEYKGKGIYSNNTNIPDNNDNNDNIEDQTNINSIQYTPTYPRSILDDKALHYPCSSKSIKTQIVKTMKKGWGISCSHPVFTDECIAEYVGEVISKDECEIRKSNEKNQQQSHDDLSYLLKSVRISLNLQGVFGNEVLELFRNVVHNHQPLVKLACIPSDGVVDPIQLKQRREEIGIYNFPAQEFVDTVKQQRSSNTKFDINAIKLKALEMSRLKREYNERNHELNENRLEVIKTLHQCEHYLAESTKPRQLQHYYFDLNRDCVIDACTYGSHARFFNHSCQANCYTRLWVVDKEQRIGMFANSNIPAQTELCINYGFEMDDIVNLHRCRCGSSNCNGFIGGQRGDKDRYSKILGSCYNDYFDGSSEWIYKLPKHINLSNINAVINDPNNADLVDKFPQLLSLYTPRASFDDVLTEELQHICANGGVTLPSDISTSCCVGGLHTWPQSEDHRVCEAHIPIHTPIKDSIHDDDDNIVSLVDACDCVCEHLSDQPSSSSSSSVQNQPYNIIECSYNIGTKNSITSRCTRTHHKSCLSLNLEQNISSKSYICRYHFCEVCGDEHGKPVYYCIGCSISFCKHCGDEQLLQQQFFMAKHNMRTEFYQDVLYDYENSPNPSNTRSFIGDFTVNVDIPTQPWSEKWFLKGVVWIRCKYCDPKPKVSITAVQKNIRNITFEINTFKQYYKDRTNVVVVDAKRENCHDIYEGYSILFDIRRKAKKQSKTGYEEPGEFYSRTNNPDVSSPSSSLSSSSILLTYEEDEDESNLKYHITASMLSDIAWGLLYMPSYKERFANNSVLATLLFKHRGTMIDRITRQTFQQTQSKLVNQDLWQILINWSRIIPTMEMCEQIDEYTKWYVAQKKNETVSIW